MPRLKAYLQALGGQHPLAPSIRQLQLGQDQLHKLGGTRLFLCRRHLLVLRLHRLGLRAPAGTSPVVAMLSHHRQRGGRLQVVSQRWDRYHPHLPTGWMRSGLLLSLNLSPKNQYDNDPPPLTHSRFGGLKTALSLSLQTAQTLL